MASKEDTIMGNLFVEDHELEETVEHIDEEIKLPDPKANIVSLPSKGLLGYPEYIEYREMMVGDEEVLASATGSTYSKTLNAVLKSVLNDCPFYEKLTLADRDWALIWVWANNYSAIKGVDVTCNNPSCGHTHTHKVDLTELEQIPIKENIKKNFPKDVALSKTGGTIRVNYITVADELFVEEFSANNPDVRVEHALLVRAIDVGVSVPFDKKLEWVKNNITSAEMAKIRKLHTHFFYGLKTTIDYTCPACKEVTHGEIPFQVEDVLYPTVSDDFEDFILD